MKNKPILKLVVNNKERIDMSELRTPIGKLCLKLTRKPKPVNPDGKLRGFFGSLFSSLMGEYKAPEGQPFGVIKGSLASTCAEVYSSLAAFVPRGKSPKLQAEQTLRLSGWTEQQIQEVRLLEQKMHMSQVK